MEQIIDLRFAGISIRILSPVSVEIPETIQPFLAEIGQPDEIFRIQLLPEPMELPQNPVYASALWNVYREPDGWTRIKLGKSYNQEGQVACRLRDTGEHTLYLPVKDFALRFRTLITPLLAPEYLLSRRNGFLLHSSVVQLQDKVVLFCGPSGIGKSTQAELWRTHLGADILNGDRCAVTLREDGFWGSGSPYSGTSGIYKPDEGPITAIVLLQQSSENTIRKATTKEIAQAFYRETITNTWDQAFIQHSLNILDRLIQTVPVYTLHCRPDAEAAQLAFETIYM